MARIAIIDGPEMLGEDRQQDLRAIIEAHNRVPAPLGILLHSPGLAPKVLAAGMHVRTASLLSPAERELVIIAVAREKTGRYEWAHHVERARAEGVGERTIDEVRRGGPLEGCADQDRDLVLFVRELVRTNQVGDEVFARVHDRYGDRGTVEIAALIGHYEYMAAINNAFAVEPPPGGDGLLPPEERPPG